MLVRLVFILFASIPFYSFGQSVVIDIEYQPNTKYEWTRTLINDGTVEYLGAEDMGDWLDLMGLESYIERKNNQYIEVKMHTADWDYQKLPFHLSIDSLYKEMTSNNEQVASFQESNTLEIEDLEIKGVINHFQKIEIDSIYGVDSLDEKNRVFRLLDEIHRSWTYPKDTLQLGEPAVKVTPYNKSLNGDNNSSIRSTYTLESIEDGIAKIKLGYLFYLDNENEIGDILDSRTLDGSGTGLLLYDINLKQVVLHEYTMELHATSNIMEMTAATTSTTTYRWTMDVFSRGSD